MSSMQTETSRPIPAPQSVTPSAKPSILVVEDEEVSAIDLQDILRENNYDVVAWATTGEDAVALCREEQPDLVLMDINLEGEMDGIEAARVLQSSSEIPVIFLTTLSDSETFERAKICEPDGYILKPFQTFELNSAIQLALMRARKTGALLPPLAATSELNESQKEIKSVLERFEPFCSLGEQFVAEVAQQATLETFDAKQPILFEGDSRERGLFPVSGRIGVMKASASGKELTVELLPPGDPFGIFAALYSTSRDTTLIAQTKTEVIWIPRGILQRLVDEHPEITRKLVAEVFTRLRKAHNLSRSLAHDSVEVRVASTLLAMVPRFSKQERVDGLSVPSIKVTRLELAEMIGSTSETVIRITKAMEREGILELGQSGVIKILDQDRLATIAE